MTLLMMVHSSLAKVYSVYLRWIVKTKILRDESPPLGMDIMCSLLLSYLCYCDKLLSWVPSVTYVSIVTVSWGPTPRPRLPFKASWHWSHFLSSLWRSYHTVQCKRLCSSVTCVILISFVFLCFLFSSLSLSLFSCFLLFPVSTKWGLFMFLPHFIVHFPWFPNLT